MSKRLFFGLHLIALSVGMLCATSLAQAQLEPRYACALGQGSVHAASDLKGGDLREHQSSDGFTCYAASKPSESNGRLSCEGRGSLHLVSDLKGGVLREHQEGNPPKTCIQGNLPMCAAGEVATNPLTHAVFGSLTPDSVCVINILHAPPPPPPAATSK